jgi:hypothetical protein
MPVAYCPNCGAARLPDARFCGSCGADLAALDQPAKSGESSAPPEPLRAPATISRPLPQPLVAAVPTASAAPTIARHGPPRSTVGLVLVLVVIAGGGALLYLRGGGAGSSGLSSPVVRASTTPLSRAPTRRVYQGVFVPTGSMTTARAAATATLLADGTVLIAGGCGPGDNPLASAELYYPQTGSFRATGSMLVGHCSAAAAVLPNGQVLIAGGDSYANNKNTPIDYAEVYDPASGTFKATGRMVEPRSGAHLIPLTDGSVLVVDGATTGYTSTASAELYDPRVGVFRPTGSMSVARGDAATERLADGRVLVAGGTTSTQYVTWLASAEVYDPATGSFSPTGSMATARDFASATLMPEGRVLVAGGRAGQTALSAAETYDPSTGRFTPTGSMTIAREYPAQVLLSDGSVLVAGGYQSASSGLSWLASAEIYDAAIGSFSQVGGLPQGYATYTAILLDDGTALVTPVSSSLSAELFR